MTITQAMIRELTKQYFHGRMPCRLKEYLYDRYGKEPLEGDLSEQFFWPAVLSDIQSYLDGSLDTRIRTPLEKLQERYEELAGITSCFAESNRALEKELRYLHDYISWKQLEDEFRYFLENAHEEPYEDLPFTHYVL